MKHFLAGLLLAVALALCAAPSTAQDKDSLLVVNVSDDVIRAGLSLTKVGVAEVGDQYAVGGSFLGTKPNAPSRVTIKVMTHTGKSVKRTGRLQKAIIGNSYGFVVFLPRSDGALKLVNISK
jgi:hypothetical protein